MVVTFILGVQGGGYPQEVNAAGEQGVQFSTNPPFNYQGHQIHGIRIWAVDINNYNLTLNDRNIIWLQAEERNINRDTNRMGKEILVINSPHMRGFAVPRFTFELNSASVVRREHPEGFYLELRIKPRKIDLAIPEGIQITEVHLRFDREDQLTAARRKLEREIRDGTRTFTVQDYHEYRDVSTGGRFGNSEILTIQNPGQVVAQTTPEEPNRDETPPPNDETPFPLALDELFTLQTVQDYGTWSSIQLANPKISVSESVISYQFIVLDNKTHKDKLKASNTIRIKGIQVAPDKAWVKTSSHGGSFDILGHYRDIEVVSERETDNPLPPPPKNPSEIIFEAILNDPQLKTILTANRISGDDFYEYHVLGKEASLVNADQTLNYTKIKELLKVDSPTPNSPPNPNGPSSPQPSPSNAPTPTQENNQQSEKNIRDISQTSSLDEAKQRAKQEINDLLDRYGVKVEQISTLLWENETSWEVYLTSKCSTVDQVSQFVKKMKMAVIQQSKHNQQDRQKLTVPQLRTKIKQEIEELIKKYPHLKTEQIPALRNWETDLEKKNSHTELNAFERQLREAIISASRHTTPTSNSKPTWSRNLLIGGVIFFVVAALGCLVVIIRNKRVKRLRKK